MSTVQRCGFLGCTNPITTEDPMPWSMCDSCYYGDIEDPHILPRPRPATIAESEPTGESGHLSTVCGERPDTLATHGTNPRRLA